MCEVFEKLLQVFEGLLDVKCVPVVINAGGLQVTHCENRFDDVADRHIVEVHCGLIHHMSGRIPRAQMPEKHPVLPVTWIPTITIQPTVVRPGLSHTSPASAWSETLKESAAVLQLQQRIAMILQSIPRVQNSWICLKQYWGMKFATASIKFCSEAAELSEWLRSGCPISGLL